MEKDQKPKEKIIVLDDSIRAFLGEETYQEMVEKLGEPPKSISHPQPEHPKFTNRKNP